MFANIREEKNIGQKAHIRCHVWVALTSYPGSLLQKHIIPTPHGMLGFVKENPMGKCTKIEKPEK